jgi:hypothetical protein
MVLVKKLDWCRRSCGFCLCYDGVASSVLVWRLFSFLLLINKMSPTTFHRMAGREFLSRMPLNIVTRIRGRKVLIHRYCGTARRCVAQPDHMILPNETKSPVPRIPQGGVTGNESNGDNLMALSLDDRHKNDNGLDIVEMVRKNGPHRQSLMTRGLSVQPESSLFHLLALSAPSSAGCYS